ncbi:hypothetical protein BH10PSE2_BH10PSE2_03170 [soil metagenome]
MPTLRRFPIVATCVVATALCGCVSLSRSSAVTPLAMTSGGYRVTAITVTTGQGVGARPEFAGIFEQHVGTRLSACATGTHSLRLEASIDRLSRANPAQVMIVGGANVLRGHARLVDPATGRVVGEYEIGKTIMGSRFGIFQMAQSEEQLSDAFASELCDQAFATN